jgi:small conductance mechanosensitive channel
MSSGLTTMQQLYHTVLTFLVTYSFQIAASLVLMFIGWKVSAWTGKQIGRLAERNDVDRPLALFLGDLVRFALLALVVVITLGNFGITIAPLIAAAGAAAFGATVAIRGPLSNFGAGLAIILSRPFVLGNTITVRGVSGVVEEIKLGATVLVGSDGSRVTIPNQQIVGDILVNSRAHQLAESRLRIGYDVPVDRALELLRNTVATVPDIAADPPAQIGVLDLGDGGPILAARYWVPNRKYFDTRFAVNHAILSAFANAGIRLSAE